MRHCPFPACRTAEQSYVLSGIPAAQNWVKYHGEKGGYDVAFTTDPSTAFRGGASPELFRYQIQGPQARELVETVFGGPLPPWKFFPSPVPAIYTAPELAD
jgi:vanillate/3-O-methylgallate O-demethylase